MNFKKLIIFFVFAIILILAFACGGGPSSESPSTGLQNALRENTTPIGLSSFAIGVSNKFPLEDSQVAEGIGYKTASRSVRHIATNELYTFPEAPTHQQIIDTVREFIELGHTVTHEIHILNGPAMRRCTDRWINGVTRYPVCSDDFDNLVRDDAAIRDALLNLFAEVVRYAQHLEELGATVLISIELEDNHSIDATNSYGIMVGLLEQAGWTDRSKMVRNSVKNFSGANLGLRTEYHPHSLSEFQALTLSPGDIVNTDGNTFSFDSDTAPAPYLFSENDIRILVDKTQERGIIFYIWHDRLQGLIQHGPSASFSTDGAYQNRNYILNKPKEMIAILLGIHVDKVDIK